MSRLLQLGMVILGLVLATLAMVIGNLTGVGWLSLSALPLFFVPIALLVIWTHDAAGEAKEVIELATGLEDLDLDL